MANKLIPVAQFIQEVEEKININSMIFNLSLEEKIKLRKLIFSFLGSI